MEIPEKDYLAHYGIIRRSGRYPWGSGENPYQRNQMFLQSVKELEDQGMTQVEIAEGFGITTTELRQHRTIAKNEIKQADINQAQRLKDKGYSNVAIAERMNLPSESSVRALLAPAAKERAQILDSTTQMLKDEVEKKKYLDIGEQVEQQAGVSRTHLNTAIAKAVDEGYKVQYLRVPQLGTGELTSMKVLTKDDVSWKELKENQHKVQLIQQYSEDGGRTFLGIEPPTSISSDRVAINYSEKDSEGNEIGGGLADGVIYVRPGVDDVSLGKSRYAQVRIAVDDTHFIKGMAVYKSDLPPGADLVFNTNKSRAEAPTKQATMKPLKDDPDNPFGAVVTRQHGTMNILREEGEWDTWSKTLSTQMLSKQSPNLAKTQLDMTFERKQNELQEIQKLTNPTVRRTLLQSFADDADSSSVHLKAAALPRQNTRVLLPVNSMKDNEIYAPSYRDGERVVLIRYPHGGIFEIPELTVNNRQPEARSNLGNAQDAVAINSRVAERLSGADFDGDTVLVIPNNQGRVKTSPALEGLKDFDPKVSYPKYEGMRVMSESLKQQQMGVVSNLITDMTLKGANQSEIARAVRHSMVVIDAAKHELDYKSSEIDNGIPQLKKKYQGRVDPDGRTRSGASTLISRTSSPESVPRRKPRPASEGGPIDRNTGKKVFVETGESYVNKAGETVYRITKEKKGALTDDAHTLSSGTPMEKLYADHSNRLKSLANQARKEMLDTKSIPYSPSAKATYSAEVDSLNAKLNTALANAPRERQAQLVANQIVRQKREASPDMEADEVKKLKGQALNEARLRVGASKDRVEITEREWEAIQAGAISNHKLERILTNGDLDQIKTLATPRQQQNVLSTAMSNRARTMLESGYTQAEVADHLGVSVSTITDALR